MNLFKKTLRVIGELLLVWNFMLSVAIVGTLALVKTLQVLNASGASEWVVLVGTFSVSISVILVVIVLALNSEKVFNAFNFSEFKKEKKADE